MLPCLINLCLAFYNNISHNYNTHDYEGTAIVGCHGTDHAPPQWLDNASLIIENLTNPIVHSFLHFKTPMICVRVCLFWSSTQ